MAQSNPCDTLFANGTLNRLIAGASPDCQTAGGPPDRLVSGSRTAHSGSPLHHFELIMQTDGNLVLYRHEDSNNTNTPKWSSGTQNKGATECILQTDGNLVLYTPEHVAVWASNTVGCGVTATMQDDGNFVIYDGNKHACWATHTVSGDIIAFLISIVIGIYRAIRAIINWLSDIFSQRR